MKTGVPCFQQSLFDRSLRWVVSHEERLLRQSANESNLRHVIRMAELTMVAGVVLRCSGLLGQPEPGRIAKGWVAKAWRFLGWGESMIRAIESEDGGAILAASYVPFVSMERRSSRVEGALVSSLPCKEKEPIPRMYADMALAQLSLGSRRTAISSFQRWWKIAKMEPLDQAAYAITHAAFAFTDLMLRPNRCPLKLREVICACFPEWQRSALKAENWDLLGEILMASHCINHACAEPQVWKALAVAQRKDGAMAAARMGWKLAYHPTFAVLMASGLCLQRHANPAAAK